MNNPKMHAYRPAIACREKICERLNRSPTPVMNVAKVFRYDERSLHESKLTNAIMKKMPEAFIPLKGRKSSPNHNEMMNDLERPEKNSFGLPMQDFEYDTLSDLFKLRFAEEPARFHEENDNQDNKCVSVFILG